MRIKFSYNEDSSICKTTLPQAYLSKRKGARTEETVLTPKLKKNFNYSIAQEAIFYCLFSNKNQTQSGFHIIWLLGKFS